MNCFVFANPEKCIGCRTCEIACVVAHSDTNIFTAGLTDVEFNPRLKMVKTAYLSVPVQCRHCEDAPCANACPTGAIINRDGVIEVKEDACIGCKTCSVVCPYGAIEMVGAYQKGEPVQQLNLQIKEAGKLTPKQKIIANKCDFCVGREGGPACAEVCPTKALTVVRREKLTASVRGKREKAAAGLAAVAGH